MLTVYGRATSSNVQIVMWALTELGLEAERLDYGFNFGGLDTDAYGALNPNRLVPVLVDSDGDVTVWESGAILRYLAAKYGGGGPFWPADPGARAAVDMWAEWGKGSFSRVFILQIFWPRVRTAAADRDEAALAAGVAQFEALLDLLEDQLGGRNFVVGNMLTAADIMVGHVLYRWFTVDVRRKRRPVIEAYYARLTRRPAYAEHVMVDYEILRAEGA
jgi:glutathione S-transferase